MTSRGRKTRKPGKPGAAGGGGSRPRRGGGGREPRPGRAPRRAGEPGDDLSTRIRRLSLRGAGAILLALGFVGGLGVAAWVLEQDRIVVSRFEGRTFVVPSKVLSAPTIIYPGLDWRRLDLRGLLLRLGYREHRFEAGAVADSPLPIARFHRQGDRLRVHLRAFEHPSRPEPEREVELLLEGDVIAAIRERPREGGPSREVGAVLLEPELVGAYFGHARQQRDLVRLEDVPWHLTQAIFAVEDKRFQSHHGIDLRRIAGAFAANLRAGGIRQGGSTLTQQLVKNFFLTPERTLRRKLQEAVMSVLVEGRYDKHEILESYLNEIYLGQRGATAIHGVGEAARFFFGEEVADLSLSESALLAATIQSPNRLSPHRNPERAKLRRDLVLGLMRDQGRIGVEEYAVAEAEPIHVSDLASGGGEPRYFLDFLRRQLPEIYDQDVLTATGLRIYSTLDPRYQRAAEAALQRGLESIEESHPELVEEDRLRRLQACVIALRPQTGEVLALVGGRDYGDSQFDRCTQARRQVGSVFKPFVYVAGLEPEGGTVAITLASFLDDEPLEVETHSGVWAPANYDKQFRGRVSVREAMARSLNVPAARLAQEVGIDRVAEMAHRLGVMSSLPRVPSLALGTAELSPLEVARAYATLASGGFRATPHTFEDVVASGDTLDRRTLRSDRVIDPGVAYLATALLQGVVDHGTGVRVRWMGVTGPVAGKTGTTDDEHDLWFVGFTPELVAVVWIGFDEPRSISGVSSAEGPLPIWVDFVKQVAGDRVTGHFLRPASLRRVDVNPDTGALALATCPSRRPELFLPGTEPETFCGVGGEPGVAGERGFLRWLRDRL